MLPAVKRWQQRIRTLSQGQKIATGVTILLELSPASMDPSNGKGQRKHSEGLSPTKEKNQAWRKRIKKTSCNSMLFIS
jgi:hypothetical protein